MCIKTYLNADAHSDHNPARIEFVMRTFRTTKKKNRKPNKSWYVKSSKI